MGGFRCDCEGWLFDRRPLDRGGFDLFAVVDYWLSSPSCADIEDGLPPVKPKIERALSWEAGL